MEIERWIRAIETKEVKKEDVPSIKENHVLSYFMDYLYHKYASDLTQEELTNMAAEPSSGSTSTGTIRASKDKGSCTPQENELLAREHELVQEQDKHGEATGVVRGWFAKIKDPDHKNTIVEYLISNRGENAGMVVDLCSTSPNNVYEATKRLIKSFARRVS